MVNNVTGWAELMDGNVVKAAFTMYDTAFLGWSVAILFIIFQFMLLIKTRNLTLAWTTGIFFASLYGLSTFVKAASVQIIFVLLAFELAGILFMLIFKKD